MKMNGERGKASPPPPPPLPLALHSFPPRRFHRIIAPAMCFFSSTAPPHTPSRQSVPPCFAPLLSRPYPTEVSHSDTGTVRRHRPPPPPANEHRNDKENYETLIELSPGGVRLGGRYGGVTGSVSGKRAER
ncbi:hypothetical protein GWI33_006065 [Rhynchophorus ferrugineus]|uniref:Uncharacterized protein n=1 Tax=Rhynchophorus ferrugineus TaxID=354439 RepID=A0A834IVA4_RHYFE|nr:hypothetical protein GWI33_006065 [Rhynchophorus ferrugineus]